MNGKRERNMKTYLKKNKWLLLISLFLSMVVSAGVVFLAAILQNIVNVATEGSIDDFFTTIEISVGYLLILGVCKYVHAICNKILIKRINLSIRQDIFKNIFEEGYETFEEGDSAKYISMLTNDIKIIEENYIIPLFKIIENSITFCLAVYMLFIISPIVLIALFSCLCLIFIVSAIFSKILQKKQEYYSDALGKYTAIIKDLLGGFTIIKSFNEAHNANKDFKIENRNLTNIKYNLDSTLVMNQTTSDILGLLTMFVVVSIGSYKVLSGDLLVGTLIALVQLSNSFVNPVMEITMSIPQMQSIKPILNKMKNIGKFAESKKNLKNLECFSEVIDVKNLTFGYDEKINVLNNINLKIFKNKKILILGKSGSGKTTLVKLILGQNTNYKGKIEWDHEDIKEIDVSNVSAYIQQNVYIFNKSVRENISLYKDFPDEAIIKVLKESGLTDIALDDIGLNFSGGQKQRISVSRALIRNKSVLVVDEGTSAVDIKTSNQIEENLLNRNDLTMIVISHKINKNILKKYDQIICMDKGKIIEQGTYEELMDNNSFLSEFISVIDEK